MVGQHLPDAGNDPFDVLLLPAGMQEDAEGGAAQLVGVFAENPTVLNGIRIGVLGGVEGKLCSAEAVELLVRLFLIGFRPLDAVAGDAQIGQLAEETGRFDVERVKV